MQRNQFKAALAQSGFTQHELAQNLNMAESTLIRKVKNNSFTISEAMAIGKILSIEDLGRFFFC